MSKIKNSLLFIQYTSKCFRYFPLTITFVNVPPTYDEEIVSCFSSPVSQICSMNKCKRQVLIKVSFGFIMLM